MLAYNLTQMIYVVVKLNIPDMLVNGPRSVEDLAAMAGAHPPSLYRLFRALASQGIFAEDASGRFGLTPLSELLRSAVPGSMAPFALAYGEPWWWKAWGSLLYSVKTGEPAFNHTSGESLFEFLANDPEAARIFNANMTAMTVEEAQAVAKAYDFSDTRMLVDVGGGQGALVSAILQAHPQAHAIVFDLPAVIEGAQSNLESAGIAERCETVGGSFFERIPEGGDTYTLKDVLHDWDDQQAERILKSCRDAMSASARLLVIERIIPPGNDPAAGKLIDISMLVFTGGMERTEIQYRSLLEKSGFDLKNIFPAAGGISVIEAALTQAQM